MIRKRKWKSEEKTMFTIRKWKWKLIEETQALIRRRFAQLAGVATLKVPFMDKNGQLAETVGSLFARYWGILWSLIIIIGILAAELKLSDWKQRVPLNRLFGNTLIIIEWYLHENLTCGWMSTSVTRFSVANCMSRSPANFEHQRWSLTVFMQFIALRHF